MSDTLVRAWRAAMKAGDFERAWRVSDRVLRSGRHFDHLPRHYRPVWRGASVERRRVLVRCYRGLGDTIQFVRLVPCLRRLAGHVRLMAQPELLSLLNRMAGIDALACVDDDVPGCTYDVDVEIMELPHVLRTTVRTIPGVVPYLCVPSSLRPERAERLCVGLVWRTGGWDPERSISFELLRPLLELAEVEFHGLQLNPETAEKHRNLLPDPRRRTVHGLARAICDMDLVITVDTLAAHLAGALGVRTWTLLAHEADWRWMEGRSDSPWYPTMRLFRQPRPHDWQSAIAQAVSVLSSEVRGSIEHALRDGARLRAGRDEARLIPAAE
jgi:hypothetical protein